jgi:hypothetical protein
VRDDDLDVFAQEIHHVPEHFGDVIRPRVLYYHVHAREGHVLERDLLASHVLGDVLGGVKSRRVYTKDPMSEGFLELQVRGVASGAARDQEARPSHLVNHGELSMPLSTEQGNDLLGRHSCSFLESMPVLGEGVV